LTLSIITINRNNSFGLEKTIKSVICQMFTDFEYIIIDGASDDESVETINKYSNNVNYWLSEPDTGIYNAMNKGINKAKGVYCLFLNSGDTLISPETLFNVFMEIKGLTADIFYSDRVNSNGKIKQYPNILTIDYLVSSPINHQNSLIKRSLFLENGFYNENLKISSDWEFFLNGLWKYKYIFHHINTHISVFDIHGIGTKPSKERFIEDMSVFHNVFQELSSTIIEYREIKKTIYYNILKNNYDTKFLTFLLRVYRKIFKFGKQIISFFRVPKENKFSI